MSRMLFYGPTVSLTVASYNYNLSKHLSPGYGTYKALSTRAHVAKIVNTFSSGSRTNRGNDSRAILPTNPGAIALSDRKNQPQDSYLVD
jgi:hypothetical protein